MSASGGNRAEDGFYDAIGSVELGNDLREEDDVLDVYEEPHRGNTNGLSVLERRVQYAEELKQIEEEIQTLRQVLIAKFQRQRFLKRQLGITVISELREEMNRGVETIRTSDAYQKTTAAVQNVKEKTSAALHDKWNYLKQTNAFKSFEGKLETAYSSVRKKLVRSATVNTSNPAVFSETTEPTSEPKSSPPQSVFSLDDHDDIPVNFTSKTNQSLTSEPVGTESFLSGDQPPTESVGLSKSAAGDEPVPREQRRRSRKKE